MINGFTHLNLTKFDVLTGMPEIKLGVRYMIDGKEVSVMPASIRDLAKAEVEYETFKGWTQDISLCKTFDELPKEAKAYIYRIEEVCAAMHGQRCTGSGAQAAKGRRRGAAHARLDMHACTPLAGLSSTV